MRARRSWKSTRVPRRSTPAWLPRRRPSSITKSARYGTLKQWAQQLGIKDAVRLLDQTLQEEKKTRRGADLARGSFREPRGRGLNQSSCGGADHPRVPDAVQRSCAAPEAGTRLVRIRRTPDQQRITSCCAASGATPLSRARGFSQRRRGNPEIVDEARVFARRWRRHRAAATDRTDAPSPAP